MYNLLNILGVKDIFRLTLANSVLILVVINVNASFSDKDNNTSFELQEIAESGNLFAEDIYKVKSKKYSLGK